MSRGELVFHYLTLCLEYLKVLLPVILAWHLPQPQYMKPAVPNQKETQG